MRIVSDTCWRRLWLLFHFNFILLCFVWCEGPVLFNGSSTSLVTSPPPLPHPPLSQGWPRPLIPLNLASSCHVTLASSTSVLRIKQNKPTPCTSKVLQPEGAPVGISSRLVQYFFLFFFKLCKAGVKYAALHEGRSLIAEGKFKLSQFLLVGKTWDKHAK